MINTIKEFADKRGLTPYRMIKDTGIAPRTGYDLYNDPTQLPGSRVLSKICDAYKIQPGLLLKWVPSTDLDSE